MKIKSIFNSNKINVRSVSEYFSLPKNKREFFGAYILPSSLPCEMFSGEKEGWDSFYKKIKTEYPFQWFFRVWMFSYKNPIFKFFKIILWKFYSVKS